MISRDEARAIAFGLSPSRLVRLAYRAAADASPPTGRESMRGGITAHPYVVAGVVLDLTTGSVKVLRWHPTEDGHDPLAMPRNLIALAWADTALVEDIDSRYAQGCVPPSQEVLEECVARDAAEDGIGVSWDLFESQLRAVYGAAIDADDHFDHEQDPRRETQREHTGEE